MLIMPFTLLGSSGLFLLSKCVDGNGKSLEKGSTKYARVIHHAELLGKQKICYFCEFYRKLISLQIGTHCPYS